MFARSAGVSGWTGENWKRSWRPGGRSGITTRCLEIRRVTGTGIKTVRIPATMDMTIIKSTTRKSRFSNCLKKFSIRIKTTTPSGMGEGVVVLSLVLRAWLIGVLESRGPGLGYVKEFTRLGEIEV